MTSEASLSEFSELENHVGDGGVIFTVPNFSEGRRHEVIDAIAAPLNDYAGVKVIDLAPDADFNRTVLTAIGRPRSLYAALLEMTAEAVSRIDMNGQSGSHPRIGAQDTIPVFPLRGITLEECDDFVRALGRDIYERHKLPVYFSEHTASSAKRAETAFLRAGQYEGLAEAMKDPERIPDIGEPVPHPTAGAVILSAGTRPLVACNVLLDTTDLDLAKRIALQVRGPSGGFSTIRAVGLRFEERDCVAVSMNMFDYDATPIHMVVEVIRSLAARRNIAVLGTELVGVVPLQALLAAVDHHLQLYGFRRSQILEEHLEDIIAVGGVAALGSAMHEL